MFKKFLQNMWVKLRDCEKKQLFHMLPALAVVVVVAISVSATVPVLEAIPERLEYEEQESGQKPVTEKEDLEETLQVSDQVYTDGTYQGSARGYGGMVMVEVAIKESKISHVEILQAAGETEPYFSLAKVLCETVVKCNTWKVDVVSGATYTSKGILGAVENAITGETVNNEAPAQTQPTASPKSVSYSDPEAYKDGIYTGSAEGFGGTITVKVTISDGKISKIDVVNAAGETPSYLSKAMAVVNRIMDKNSPNVDTVSGATYSSVGIINAVKNALSSAAANGGSSNGEDSNANSATGQQNTSSSKPTDESLFLPDKFITDFSSVIKPSIKYQDGIYQGSGLGFGGDIKTQITITNGYISGIKILSADKETPVYFNKAIAVIDEILKKQSINVDVVSGATFSSEGIFEAVENALSQAVTKNSEDQTGGGDSQSENQGGDQTQDQTAENSGRYVDGIYYATVPCNNNTEENPEVYFDYILNVTLTVQDGKIIGVTASRFNDVSDEPAMNDRYIGYAVSGRSNKNLAGISSQLAEKQGADNLDVVSGATYSSKALIEGIRSILPSASKK